MLIKDMFAKEIDRDIQGVIKVGQSKDENIKQELEEYVVTKELQRHFKDFFSDYKQGIKGNTDKMGVWISGFFGSGKSHFLKILSYLLENNEVDGKKAFQYFLDDEKIINQSVLEDMKLACNTPTDIVLFNIDSKSKSAGTKGKDSILNVFLKVFNEMQNFSTDPHLADLERQLKAEGKYEDFQKEYQRLNNSNWLDNRHQFKFHKDKVVKTLVEIGFMSEESAREWIKTTTKSYEISIDEFAKMVRDYLDSKDENHHIVFLVDEIGQYIGNNTDLMLNLQTITEDLGTACNGKAWIVVTSQQDIDSITEVQGRDFSKIQGRFNTRLNLTSANVDEVIKLRILDKTETAKETLSVIYENNETIIKNLLIFNDGIDKKLYNNSEDFCQVYPFIPYQFNLLADVLTSIRQHGASGKHLSEGERSMLALFKESAEKLMDKEDGEIVPFNIFYGGLEKFLDHSHSAVITRALENEKINPYKEEDNFNVDVLKTLFLIKYVKEIQANLDNITTLMVSNLHDDRIELKERVEEALNILVSQTLVQKNGDLYIFLTNEEQEITREIERQPIETQVLTRKISEMIYAGILSNDKVSYSKLGNRYNFDFNKFVDGDAYRFNPSSEIGIDIITPNSEKSGIEEDLRMSSARDDIIYVNLPNDRVFIDEIRTEIKIEKYLQISSSSDIPRIEQIKALKRVELREHQNRSKLYLEEALKEADFYIHGDKIDHKSRNFQVNVDESLQKLINIVYHKLDYIDIPMDDQEIRKLFNNRDDNTIELKGLESTIFNDIQVVLDFIKLKTKNHRKISLKEIKDRFIKSPYGYIALDVEWIVSKIFLDGNISLSLNGETISLLNQSQDKIINYISKKQYAEKLLIEEKEVIDEKYIKNLKDISYSLFGRKITENDTDMVVKIFNDSAWEMIKKLNIIKINYSSGDYPGENIIKKGILLLNSTREISNTKDIFQKVFKNKDKYLDFGEDYQPIKSFFEGEQKNIWDKSQDLLSKYEDSKSYIYDESIENITKEMYSILSKSNPYSRIKDLSEIKDKFLEQYSKLLDKELEPVKIEIEQAKARVMEELEKTEFKDLFEQRYRASFQALKEKAESSNNISKLNGIKIEADRLKMRYLDEIAKKIDELEAEKDKRPEKRTGKENEPPTVTKPHIKRKNIRIRDINPTNSWKIESKADLDKYIRELKESLEKELDENIILNIEF
ncbi:MAG: BREX system P-loop protein BrxC [Anaerococcus sp.]